MEYSISQGLAELKLLDKRINKEIEALKNVGLAKGKDKFVTWNILIDTFIANAKSDYQKITDLITRRNNIQAAIMKSNANTMVKVNDVQMTVVDAIAYKEVINYKRTLLDHIRSNLNIKTKEVETANRIVEDRLQKLLETQFGNKDKDSQDVKTVSEPFNEINKYKLIDPLSSMELIQKLDKEIDEFEHMIDYTLSESNAVTKIIIE